MTNRFPAELTLLSSILPFSVDSMSISPALLSIVFPVIFPTAVIIFIFPVESTFVKSIVPVPVWISAFPLDVRVSPVIAPFCVVTNKSPSELTVLNLIVPFSGS